MSVSVPSVWSQLLALGSEALRFWALPFSAVPLVKGFPRFPTPKLLNFFLPRFAREFLSLLPLR